MTEKFYKLVKYLLILILILIIYLNCRYTLLVLGERLDYYFYNTYIPVFFGISLSFILIYLIPKIKAKKHFSIFMILIINLIMFAFRIYYQKSFYLAPSTDQGLFYEASSKFFLNDLTPIQVGEYLNLLPNQFNLNIIFNLLYHLLSPKLENLYLLNDILVSLSIINLSYLAAKIKGSKAALITSILLNAFLPLTFLTAVIYGDIFQLYFFTIALNFFYLEKNIITYSITGFVLGFAYLARTSTLVMLIAMIIVIYIYHHNKKQILTIIISFLLISQGLPMFYKLIYPSDYKTLPNKAYIISGISRNDAGYAGHYNAIGYSYFKFEVDLDKNKANDFYNQIIIEELNKFKKPSYAIKFFKEKTTYTYTEPDFDTLTYIYPNDFGQDNVYQNYLKTQEIIGCGYETTTNTNEFGSFIYDNVFKIKFYDKIINNFVYFTFLLIVIFKPLNNKHLLIPLSFLGIFFFHSIIETRSRYVLIYFIILIFYVSINLTDIFPLIIAKTPKKLKNKIKVKN